MIFRFLFAEKMCRIENSHIHPLAIKHGSGAKFKCWGRLKFQIFSRVLTNTTACVTPLLNSSSSCPKFHLPGDFGVFRKTKSLESLNRRLASKSKFKTEPQLLAAHKTKWKFLGFHWKRKRPSLKSSADFVRVSQKLQSSRRPFFHVWISRRYTWSRREI